MKPCDHCNVTQYQLDLAAKRGREPATYHEENCPTKRSPYTPMPWAEQPASEPHNGEELGADAAVTLEPEAQRLVTVAELATRWATIKELPNDMGALWPIWEVKAPDGMSYKMTFGVEATRRVIRGASAARPLYLPGMNSKGEISNSDMMPLHFQRVHDWQIDPEQNDGEGWRGFTEPLSPKSGMHEVDCHLASAIWRPTIFAELETGSESESEPEPCNCDHARDMESQRDYWKMRCEAADRACDQAQAKESDDLRRWADGLIAEYATKEKHLRDALDDERRRHTHTRELLAQLHRSHREYIATLTEIYGEIENLDKSTPKE
jgi:hypothetical protein